MNDEPRYGVGDIVYIAEGDYYFEGVDSEESIGEVDLEVVSSDYDGEWLYNLRNDDGDRVWNVKESDLA